jgi:Uma2 family endonuclease
MASVTVAAATTSGERHPHRFTTDAYHRMGESGVLDPDDRLELLDGEVIEMSPIGTAHAACVNRLAEILSQSLTGRAIVSVQNPILLSDISEPQPDIALLKRRPDFYAERHAGPADVLLLVEVADTSAALDRQVKVPLYAAARIRETWVVDLSAGVVEVYRQPGGGTYAHVREGRSGPIAPLAFPDVSFDIAEILP